jgi:hypothetical protein
MNTEGLELKFTKLDGRHRGHNEFTHYLTVIEKPTSRYYQPIKYSVAGFFALRSLCSETWGLSCERELYLELKPKVANNMLDVPLNNHWVWHTDLNNNQYRIYLKSDEERAWLLLKW